MAKQAVIKAVCAAAKEAGPLKHGGDRKSESADQDNNCNVDRKQGNDQTYLARKLLTEQPETFTRLEAGEFRSVRAAAKHCGIVKDKPTKAVCAAAKEAGPLKTPTEAGSMKGRKADDNNHPLPKGSTDPTYLARKLLTEQPETFSKLKAENVTPGSNQGGGRSDLHHGNRDADPATHSLHPGFSLIFSLRMED